MKLRKKRLIKLMESYDKPQSTEQIKNDYNKLYYKWGYGSNNELAQVLSKGKEFENKEIIEWHKSGKMRKNYAGWVLR